MQENIPNEQLDSQDNTTQLNFGGESGGLMKIFTELATTESKLKKEMLTKKYKKRVRKLFNKLGVK